MHHFDADTRQVFDAYFGDVELIDQFLVLDTLCEEFFTQRRNLVIFEQHEILHARQICFQSADLCLKCGLIRL
ncbi:hypothetical protein D1872_320040 [compost metagenome]